ncbi:type II toxin-antitoxin system Phd/YefM family antitoxin [Enterococcus mundtii]|uniref:type II toxin-antitoxin system Phd/YefM family antitoxin n=1 Tax=Enterococcus mundtii TaxID=53346 RepID=UPI001378677D|nr:type II toxin-antitoxin system prevent-host-death family antitoxin [Enterococcus mundtii]NBA62684.1 type II toxin-antitoxin system prevent-host-death family antitoxin [Enterococcus mundtii]
MANTVLNPSSARKDFYKLLKDVNENHTEMEIISERSENNAMLIGLDDWKAIKETLLFEQTGTLDIVRRREKDDS